MTETVSDMLSTLDEDDYKMAVSYIRFLYISKKERKVQQAKNVMDEIQAIIGEDKGWDSEDDMLKDMADFRRKRFHLFPTPSSS